MNIGMFEDLMAKLDETNRLLRQLVKLLTEQAQPVEAQSDAAPKPATKKAKAG